MPFRIRVGTFIVVSALCLGACDSVIYSGPSRVSLQRAEVHQDNVSMEAETAAMSAARLQDIGKDYWRRGESPLLLTVTYDPGSKANTARKASDAAERFAAALRQQGVRNLQVDTLPVRESGDVSKTLVSYNALSAHAPAGCEDTLDMDMLSDLERSEKYDLGCSIETFTARQVARPRDLTGSDNMDNGQGRYSANSLERYMSGEANEALEGESASEN